MKNKTGIIILAAGNSSRLKQPKQLLDYNGTTLLRHIILQAKSVPQSEVVVVIGAFEKEMEQELSDSGTTFVYNADWKTGMGSSISVGLALLLRSNSTIKNCIITVCDQPFLSTTLFNDLITAHTKSKKGIVAAAYSQTQGTPVLFNNTYFQSLLDIQPEEGAKKMIQQYQHDLALVTFEKGAIDIDTIEDYNKLMDQQQLQ